MNALSGSRTIMSGFVIRYERFIFCRKFMGGFRTIMSGFVFVMSVSKTLMSGFVLVMSVYFVKLV